MFQIACWQGNFDLFGLFMRNIQRMARRLVKDQYQIEIFCAHYTAILNNRNISGAASNINKNSAVALEVQCHQKSRPKTQVQP